MVAHVIDTLQPVGQPRIEFLQAGRPLAGQAQGGLEVLLHGVEEALDLALAPGVVGLGVEQADAQVGADDPGVVVDEGAALIGVELARHAAAADGFLEAGVKAARVGLADNKRHAARTRE